MFEGMLGCGDAGRQRGAKVRHRPIRKKSASSDVRRGALDTLASAPQVGLEPTTLRLTVGCSDQLSYWGMVWNRPRNLARKRLKSTGASQAATVCYAVSSPVSNVTMRGRGDAAAPSRWTA